jgi:uncharacterized protein (TIGR02466 family)
MMTKKKNWLFNPHKKNDDKETSTIQLFANPLMLVPLDLDVEKLTEFAFEMWNKDKKGNQYTNRGGWHSDIILEEEPHEEFIKLKKEITQHLQLYHSEVFRGMKFKENVVQSLGNMWVNINEKYHYNGWHMHPGATLSGVYYIKHDGSTKQGDIMFKNPIASYMESAHWSSEGEWRPNLNVVESWNMVTAGEVNITPNSNMLFIFPSWLEHKVELNLKNDSRISLSFNSRLKQEKKS